MLLATLTKEMQIPPWQAVPLALAGLALFFAGIQVYRKMLRRVAQRGGLVRSDLLGLPDTLVAASLIIYSLLLFSIQWFGLSETPKPPANPDGAGGAQGLQIIYSSLMLVVPAAAILAFLVSRGVDVGTFLGLRRLRPLRAMGTAAGLILLLLPIFVVVAAVAYQLLGGQAEQQELVKIYQQAAKSGNYGIIWQVIVTAVLIAPLAEEFLFRGYFYPVLKRFAGAVPAALFVSVLFALIHNNALALPGLTLLALALTLAYEWSGSIVLPVFMHACFNGLSLLGIWWNVQHAAQP